jgi:multidrug efflux pump subunit AcrA (membrane-fusion protein)
VLVVDQDNKAAVRTITIGSRYEQYYVVSHGLEPGERVIVEGQQKVRPGMIVLPTMPPASGDKTPEPKKGS